MSAILTNALKKIVEAWDEPSYGDREAQLDKLFDPIEEARPLIRERPVQMPPGAGNTTLLAQHVVAGQYPVSWYKIPGGKYNVVYGGASEEFTDDLDASEYYGTCIRHALECAGHLDN